MPELSIFAVEALLKECRSQTLHHAAANLLLNEQRINDATAIFNNPELQNLYEAGLGVDLDMAGLNPVGKRERETIWSEMMGHRELRTDVARQRVGAEIGNAGNLREGYPLGSELGVNNCAIAEIKILSASL